MLDTAVEAALAGATVPGGCDTVEPTAAGAGAGAGVGQKSDRGKGVGDRANKSTQNQRSGGQDKRRRAAGHRGTREKGRYAWESPSESLGELKETGD